MDVDLDGLAIPQLNAMAYHALLRCERGELDPAEAAARRVIDDRRLRRPADWRCSRWAPT